MTQDPLLTSKKLDYETPWEFFNQVDQSYGPFTLDACATKENAKCGRFFSPEDDAFQHQWTGRVWMNPPYGREIGKWMAKALVESQTNDATVVCLVPARTDTRWWWNYVIDAHAEVRFLHGRIAFGGGKYTATFPSALVIYRPELRSR